LGLQGKLHYYALSLTADHEKANDLLQETLLKALTHRETFSHNTNFKAWIYTIMKNTFINEYRRNVKSRKTFDSSDWNSGTVWMKNTESNSPDTIYRSKEIVNRITGLDDEFRIPFTMFLEGFKYKEIADELNLPLGTVKSRIFFARKKLEKVLGMYSMN
jgi:RNA polymerase sigma-70 factor (ECF subfamily)